MQKVKYLSLCTLLFSLTLLPGCNKNNSRIMIIGVNNNKGWEETSVLIDSLENKKLEKIDNISFYTGNIKNKSVVIAESPIGTSEAAMTTTIGIKQYHPQYVISEGTAGAHHEGVKINDIVLGKDILDMASYEGPADDPQQWIGNYNGLQHPPLHSDENLLKIASEVNCKEAGEIKSDGVISSSDCWNTSEDFVKKLYERYQEDCEEMESYAVSTVALNYEIPFISIRSISNNVGKDDFNPEAAEVVQNFALDFIELL